MKKLYDDVEKAAFTILLLSGAVTKEQLKKQFDVEESTARSWKSEFLKNEQHSLCKVEKVMIGSKSQEVGLYLKININR